MLVLRNSFIVSQIVALLLCAAQATADDVDRVKLGVGSLFTNDRFGDGHDRWRTGSFVRSAVYGPPWQGTLPGQFGDLIEYRFSAEIVAPSDLSDTGPGDRPYAGIVSLGAHTHFIRKGNEVSLGFDITVTGSSTGLDSFQSFVHENLSGNARVSPSISAGQIGDAIHPSFVLEVGRPLQLRPSLSIRPYMEVRAGLETLTRIGGDLTITELGNETLLFRDVASGQRYRSIYRDGVGLSIVAGGDIAYVYDTALLPESRGFKHRDMRARLRLGLHSREKGRFGWFLGAAWLSEEFVDQSESQIVGSIDIGYAF